MATVTLSYKLEQKKEKFVLYLHRVLGKDRQTKYIGIVPKDDERVRLILKKKDASRKLKELAESDWARLSE